jgi:hypothetical protein
VLLLPLFTELLRAKVFSETTLWFERWRYLHGVLRRNCQEFGDILFFERRRGRHIRPRLAHLLPQADQGLLLAGRI